jgi:hypothetical protein
MVVRADLLANRRAECAQNAELMGQLRFGNSMARGLPNALPGTMAEMSAPKVFIS